MEPLSVCLVVRDAAALLPDCLTGIRTLTPDIVIVVDDRTTDDTARIAREVTSQVFTHSFTDFAAQKNFALSQSRTDWNLFLDADERLSPELVAEIKQTLIHPDFAAYSIPRLNYIFKRPIYHTNWDPYSDSHIWLFRKSVSTWVGRVHEEVEVKGRVGRLRHPKIHLAYDSVETFVTKLNHYTSLEISTRSAVWEFIRRYFWHLGFLDGWHGLFLSYLMCIYHLSVNIKLWEKKKSS